MSADEKCNNKPIGENVVLLDSSQDSKDIASGISAEKVPDISSEVQSITPVEEQKPPIVETTDDYLASAMQNADLADGNPNCEDLTKTDVESVDKEPKRLAESDSEGPFHKEPVPDAEKKHEDPVKETLKQIMELFKTKGVEHIPFYELITHPTDFSKTVQNCVNLSILMSQNAFVIESGADGWPQVRLLKPEDLTKIPRTDGENPKICTLNMRLCREVIEKYNITEPLLKIDSDVENDSDQDDVD